MYSICRVHFALSTLDNVHAAFVIRHEIVLLKCDKQFVDIGTGQAYQYM